MSGDNQEAQEKFELAVKEYLESQDFGEGLLIDWIMVTAQHIPKEDGSSATTLSILTSPQQSIYRSIGLARYAVHKTEGNLSRIDET